MRAVIYDEVVTISGQQYDINVREDSGCYLEILESFHDQMTAMLSHHSRILVLFFEIHTLEYMEDSKLISDILRKVKRWLKNNYDMLRVGHLWVREKSRKKKQHYHVALILNGDEINYPQKVIDQIEWQVTRRDLPKPYTPKNCYYFIARNDDQTFREAFYRGSYYAKEKTKGYKGKLSNNFSASRIKNKTSSI